MSWNAVSGATGYKVYRDGVQATTSTGTSATVTGLTADTAYQFSVSATNAAGESVKSAAISATMRQGAGGHGRRPVVKPRHHDVDREVDGGPGARLRQPSKSVAAGRQMPAPAASASEILTTQPITAAHIRV
ncbi:hypothetical protein SBADM41S_12202 [Streptomyces badius]